MDEVEVPAKVDYLGLLSELKDARRVLRWNTHDPEAHSDKFNAYLLNTEFKRNFYRETFERLAVALHLLRSDSEKKLQFVIAWQIFVCWKYETQFYFLSTFHTQLWSTMEHTMQKACQDGSSPDLTRMPDYISILDQILDEKSKSNKMSKLLMLRLSL